MPVLKNIAHKRQRIEWEHITYFQKWGRGMRRGVIDLAFPGGYPLIYFAQDNEIICPNCANKEYDNLTGYDVYYEGPVMQCAECNKDIESAYGDPD